MEMFGFRLIQLFQMITHCLELGYAFFDMNTFLKKMVILAHAWSLIIFRLVFSVLQGVPSQNVFFKRAKMSENQYEDKKKYGSIITKPHHLTYNL